MIYLTLDDLMYIAERVLDDPPHIRDHGLLAGAAARPSAAFAGEEAYSDLVSKAAALTHSLVGNHALVDGSKRLGLAGLIAFLGMNGARLTATDNEAYELIMALAEGKCPEAADFAVHLRPHVTEA